jgi:hypothetical protein
MSSAASTLDALINRVGGIATPFSIELPDRQTRNVGEGKSEFHVGLRNDRALRAVRTLDEADIAEAYLRGDIDIEGDMLKPFALRASLDDSHPLVAAWRFIQPLLFGQVYTPPLSLGGGLRVPLPQPRLLPADPRKTQGRRLTEVAPAGSIRA